eukprot:9662296-Alexandrium_andersonii.AAC.1
MVASASLNAPLATEQCDCVSASRHLSTHWGRHPSRCPAVAPSSPCYRHRGAERFVFVEDGAGF